ncbi:TonB-dependent receptor [Edaphobacter modestus]|uniref:Carboxypeptidase family protein n=1 Tax=Edaphobacter modestus TaxID=388466 RepID=A0A4Q7XZF4_9BACT|nr:carboxypeptidase regulatory-like domain-containing protein [Edaphobacter modestus]RZU28923.1 carboxypeptidase family protein [Edaphobacter modestus]
MNHTRWCKRVTFAIAAIFIVLTALPATAQTSGVGNISGTITDTTGATVSNASVVVTNTDTGITRAYTTSADGSFAAPFLQSGHYEVTVGGSSYAKVVRKNLTLTVGQTLSVDVALPVGSVSSEIVVNAESPLIDTEKTEVSQTIGEKLISNVPVNSRNWSAFVLLTPNVVQDGGTGLVSFHGISGLYNQNYVDGGNNNQMLFSEARGRSSGAPYVYSLDSIKEFQAQVSNYSVEFGQAVGGQVNAITKSGTDSIHGDLFYSLRYPTLNALDPFNKFSALHNGGNPFLLTQPIHQQQQFGGSVGGPIIKHRLFYFFTYDGFRRVGRALYANTNYISLSPSATTPPPAGTNPTALITPTQCPNTITSAQCVSAINFLLQTSGATSAPPSRFSKQNIFFPRIDWHINSKNDAFVNYNFANFDSTYGYNSAPTFTNSSPTTNGPTSYHERFLIAGLTTQLSGSSINQVHFQYGRDLETAGANASGPSISMGAVTYGMPNALPRIAEPDEHRTQITDVFSTIHGRHSFKFGGDVNLVHEVMINLFQGGGVYNYSGANTTINFQNWAQDSFRGQSGDTDPSAGYHYTSFVQTVDQLNTGNRAGADDFWMKMFDGFAEDSWKVRSNLTVNLGVRYDLQLTPAPIKNNTNFAPLSTQYSSTIKNVANRVQPRIGFSWGPYAGTVVRGGYGLFSGLNQGSTYYAMRVENGVVQVNYNYTGCTAPSNAPTTCTSTPTAGLTFPNVPFQPTGPSLSGALFPSGGTAPAISGPSNLGTQSFHGLDPNFVPPLAHEAELSIEQALPGHISFSVGYVGSRATRLPVFLDANLIGQTPHGVRSYNILDKSGNVVNQLTVPVYLVSDRRDARLQSYNTGFSAANSWYNSMAVTVRRPFKNGLELLMNYTWAKATDTDQVQGAFGTFYGGNAVLDPNNVRGENGQSDIDLRNRFVLSFVYQPQLFKENKWARSIVDGFIVSGTEIASAGQPIVASMSGTVFNGAGSSSSNPTNIGAGGNIYGGAMSSSSGAATTGRPPQIGRNSQVGPGFNNVDFRIARDLPIHENIHMQFSGEAFNLFNHKIATNVASTYSTYTPTNSTTCKGSAPAGSVLQGCISPFTGSGTTAFGAVTGTNNTLYGPRQLQVSAKLFF